MAGIRIGTLYTESRDLVEALAQLGSFHGISGTTQHQVAQLLRDKGTDPSFTCAFANTMYRENNPFGKDQSKFRLIQSALPVQSKQFVWLSLNS